MRKNDRGKSSCAGQLGQLVQVPGDSFELGHVVQMLASHPFFDSSEFDQFADDLGGLLARLPGEGFQLKIQRRIEPGTDDVFLSLGGAQCGAPAPVKFSFHSKSILRLDQRDHAPTDGSKPFFVYENTNLPYSFTPYSHRIFGPDFCGALMAGIRRFCCLIRVCRYSFTSL